MNKKILCVFLLITALLCSLAGLWPRFNLENKNKNVSITVDYREVAALAENSGLSVDEAIEILKNNGVTGLMVSELLGENILRGIGQAEMKIMKDSERGTEGTIISITPFSTQKDLLNKWLRMRFGVSDDKTGPLFLATPSTMLRNSGMLPDIDGLEAAKRSGLHIFYRPAPSPGHLSDKAALLLREVNEKYPVSVFTPSGEYVSGYPDVSKLANTAKDLRIPIAMVEFSRQVGEPQLNALSSPYLIPLHSVTNEEMTSRRISRKALRERLIRAALERSVRILLLRTAPPNTSNFTFNDFAQETKLLSEGLKSHGFNMAWPEPVFAENNLHTNIFTALALSIMLIICAYDYLVRMGMKSDNKLIIFFGGLCIVLAFLILKVPSIARIAGALTAPLIAVEASLIAMDTVKSYGVIPAFLFAVAGGLCIASFFSTTSYMLRLSTFSGVRLTVIMPPILVVLHDLKNRIHPESIIQFLSRPPLWGELVMIFVLLAGVVLIILRSGNVQVVSGFETKIRDTLERLLIARPRSKEVFLGYPSLLLLCYFVKNNFVPHYRELLRIGVSIGFSSVINSFCHFHTPLTLILLREFNGLWTGIIAGIIAVLFVKFIVIPVIKLIRPIIS